MVATEGAMVYVLDPQGSSIVQQVKIPGVPVDVVACGLLDVEYRLILTTRNGSVFMIKNGELLKAVIELESPPCGLVQLEKSIVIACMNRKLTSYHLKGKKNWSLTMSDDIVAIEAFNLRRSKDTRGVLVALRSGDVVLYNEKVKVCTLSTDSLITGLLFGQYGREEASLALVQKSGALSLKILKRTASLEAISEAAGPPPEQGERTGPILSIIWPILTADICTRHPAQHSQENEAVRGADTTRARSRHRDAPSFPAGSVQAATDHGASLRQNHQGCAGKILLFAL